MPRKPTKEERELWDKVAATAKPIKKPIEVLIETPKKLPKPANPVKTAKPIKPFRLGAAAKPKTALPKPAIQPPTMDAKAFGRMKQGKLRPEARIDLHGMTLSQAQPALIDFISRTHRNGARLVLVITGKGKSGEDFGPIPERRGILRQQVPVWFRQAPLGPMILEVAQAHQRHGGGGAFYVYLRRK